MAITYRCPDCEFQGKAADDAKGQEIICKGCGHTFTLPDGGAAAKNGAAVGAKPQAGQTGLVEAKCPNCMTKGKVPAAAQGKKVKCPKCSEMFTVGGEPPPPSGGPGAKLSDIGPPPEEETPAVPDDVGLTPMSDAADEAVEEVADVAILVETVCPGCKHKGNVPEKFLGKKVKCPRCSQMFVVTDAAAAPKSGAAAGSKDGQWWSGQPGEAPGKAKAAPATIQKAAGSSAGIRTAAAPVSTGDNPFAFDMDAPPPPKSAGKPKADVPRTEPAARDADEEPTAARPDSSRTIMIAVLAIFGVIVGGGLLFAVAMLVLTPAETQQAKNAPATEDLPHRLPHYVVAPPKGKTTENQPKTKTPTIDPEPKPKVDPEPMPKIDPEPKPKVDPEPVPDDKGPLRDDGGSGAVKFDNIHVNMTSIWVDHVKSPQGQSKNRYLLVQLVIENKDAAQPLEYHSWSTSAAVAGKSAPGRMSDGKGKTYKRPTPAELVVKPGGQIEREMIAPGKSVVDVLIFEPPVGDVESFRLELPAVNVGKTGTLRLNMPGYLIVGAGPPKDKDKNPPPDKPNKELTAKLDAQRAKLKSRNRAERENALKAIGDLGQAAVPALGELINILRSDPDEVVRAVAAEAIGKLGPAAKSAVGALIQALSSDYFRLKANAAEALGNIGPDAKDAIPHLKKLMTSKDEEVPLKAAQALSKIDSKGPPPRKP